MFLANQKKSKKLKILRKYKYVDCKVLESCEKELLFFKFKI